MVFERIRELTLFKLIPLFLVTKASFKEQVVSSRYNNTDACVNNVNEYVVFINLFYNYYFDPFLTSVVLILIQASSSIIYTCRNSNIMPCWSSRTKRVIHWLQRFIHNEAGQVSMGRAVSPLSRRQPSHAQHYHVIQIARNRSRLL